MHQFSILIILLILGLQFPNSDAAERLKKKMRFTSTSTMFAPHPSKPNFMGVFFEEIGRRLSIEIKVVTVPSERALINLNKGIDDGIVARVADLDKIYPNIVRIPESTIGMTGTAYSTKSLPIRELQDLAPYNLAIIRGWKILEKRIIHYKSLYMAKNDKILFNLLKLNRVDVVIYGRFFGYAPVPIFYAPPPPLIYYPLFKVKLFSYVHRDHALMVPSFVEVMRALKADGTYQRLIETYIKAPSKEQGR